MERLSLLVAGAVQNGVESTCTGSISRAHSGCGSCSVPAMADTWWKARQVPRRARARATPQKGVVGWALIARRRARRSGLPHGLQSASMARRTSRAPRAPPGRRAGSSPVLCGRLGSPCSHPVARQLQVLEDRLGGEPFGQLVAQWPGLGQVAQDAARDLPQRHGDREQDGLAVGHGQSIGREQNQNNSPIGGERR